MRFAQTRRPAANLGLESGGHYERVKWQACLPVHAHPACLMLPVRVRPRLPRRWLDPEAIIAEMGDPQFPVPVPESGGKDRGKDAKESKDGKGDEQDADEGAMPQVLTLTPHHLRRRIPGGAAGRHGRTDSDVIGQGVEGSSEAAAAMAAIQSSEAVMPAPYNSQTYARKGLLWTLDEDRFLLEARVFDPVLSWDSVVAQYATKRSGNRVSFNKRSVTVQVLKERVATLESPMLRARMVMLLRDLEQVKGAAPIDPSLLKDPSLDVDESAAAAAAKFETGPDELGDDVDVRLEGRGFRPAKLHARLGRLAHFSKRVNDVVIASGGGHRLGKRVGVSVARRRSSAIDEQHKAAAAAAAALAEGGDTDAAGPGGAELGGGVFFENGLGLLRLADTGSEYDGFDTMNHFAQDMFDKLNKFTESPNVLMNLRQVQRRIARLNAARARSSREVRHGVHHERRERLRQLEHRRTSEKYAVTQVLNRQLEADIRTLKLSHQRAILLEHKKLDAAHDRRLRSVNAFFNREEVKAEAALHAAWDKEVDLLRRKEADARDKADRIFQGPAMIRMCALACDLQSTQLRRACAHYLAQPGVFVEAATNAAWANPLITDQLVADVLGEVNMEDLNKLVDIREKTTFEHAIAREMTSRRWVARNTYRQLSNKMLYRLRYHVSCRAVGEAAAIELREDTSDEEDEGKADGGDAADGGGPASARPDEIDRRIGARRGSAASLGGMSTSDVPRQEEFHVLTGTGIGGSPLYDLTDPVFIDVIEDEIAARRQYGSAAISRELLVPQLSLDETGMLVTLKDVFRYATAHASRARSAGEFGKWMFEIEIVRMSHFGSTISVGWDVPRASLAWSEASQDTEKASSDLLGQYQGRGVALPGITPGKGDLGYGFAWQSDGRTAPENPADPGAAGAVRGVGMLLAFGRHSSGFDTYGEGDAVQCTLDQNSMPPAIRFFKNGNLSVPRPGSGKRSGLRVKSPGTYSLVPAVCMYASDGGHMPVVRFNFAGPFKHPIVGYDPYGAQWPSSDAVDKVAAEGRAKAASLRASSRPRSALGAGADISSGDDGGGGEAGDVADSGGGGKDASP